MEKTSLSKSEQRVLKWLSQYRKPSMKIYMWIIFLCTLLIWVRHWDKFAQSWSFFVENVIIWLAFNLAVYFNVKYDPVLYDLIQRISNNKGTIE